MSADEFDPAIERLFARHSMMADESLFTAQFQARLQRQSRWRGLALAGAGIVGGILAVSEGMGVGFQVNNARPDVLGTLVATTNAAQMEMQSGLEKFGLNFVDLSGSTGVVAFWGVAGVALAILASLVMRVAQEV